MLLSVPAKNLLKIQPLGPNFGLMSPRKKGIYLYKIGFCLLCYYRGEVYLAPTTPWAGRPGMPWGLSPALAQAFTSMCELVSHGMWVMESIVDFGRLWPISADFSIRPSKVIVGLNLALEMVGMAVWVHYSWSRSICVCSMVGLYIHQRCLVNLYLDRRG